MSRTHGDVYYVNIHTGESQYERPTEGAPTHQPPTPRSINKHDDDDAADGGVDGWEASKAALAAAEAAADAAVARCVLLRANRPMGILVDDIDPDLSVYLQVAGEC